MRISARSIGGPEVPLRSGILIGRHADADLRIDRRGVSIRHAIIVEHLTGWFIHDLSSAAGVRINGVRVRRGEIQTGDVVELGDVKLRIRESNKDETPNPSHPATGPHAESDEDWFAKLVHDESNRAGGSGNCHLDFFLGSKYIHSATVTQEATIGYSDRADIQLSQRGLSSIHAFVVHDTGNWYIFDLRSNSGLPVDGKAGQRLPLQDGQELQIGEYRVVVWLESADDNDHPTVTLDTSDLLDEVTLTLREAAAVKGQLDSTEQEQKEAHIELAREFQDILLQAQEADQSGDSAAAVRNYSKFCRKVPYSLPVRRLLRKAQRRLNASRGGTVPLWRAPIIFYYQLLTKFAIWKKDLPEALYVSERGLKRDPYNTGLLLLQSLVFERVNRLDLCIWTLSTARKRDPMNPHCNRPLAKIFQMLGDYRHSLGFWKLVAKADPNDRRVADNIRNALINQTLGDGILRDNKSKPKEPPVTAARSMIEEGLDSDAMLTLPNEFFDAWKDVTKQT